MGYAVLIYTDGFFLILHVCTNTVDVNQGLTLSFIAEGLRIAAWTVIGQINIITTTGIGFNTWNQIICSQ